MRQAHCDWILVWILTIHDQRCKAVLFYASAMFVFQFQRCIGEDIFIAQFAMMFGAFAAGQAQ